jgi:outer membrane protein assembly factor BamB
MVQAVTRWVIKPRYSDGDGLAIQGLAIFGELGTNDPTPNGACRAVRLSDGSDVWHCQVEAIVSSQIHAEGSTVFFIPNYEPQQGTFKSWVYAVDVATGSVRWKTSVDGWGSEFLVMAEGLVLFTSKYMKPAPSTDEDIHYVASLIDKQTGAVRKSLDLGAGFPLAAIWNSQVAIVHRDHAWIDILNPTTWTTARIYTDQQPIRAASFLADRCYITTSADAPGPSIVAAVNLATRTPEWTQPYGEHVSAIQAQGQNVAVAKGVYLSAASIGLCDNASGTAKWTVPAGTAVPLLGPVVANQLVAQIRIRPAPQPTAITIGLDLDTGAESFRFELPYSIGWISDAGQNVVLSSHLYNLSAFEIT